MHSPSLTVPLTDFLPAMIPPSMPASSRALCLNPAALGRDPVQRVALFVPAAVAEAVAQLLLASQRRMTTAAPNQLATDMNARVGALLSPFVRA